MYPFFFEGERGVAKYEQKLARTSSPTLYSVILILRGIGVRCLRINLAPIANQICLAL